MKRLLWVIVGIAIGAGGLTALPSGAQYEVAPVQMHYQMDNLIVMYDCYPARTDSAALQVYINYPSGMAIYNCEALDASRILPFIPYSRDTHISATY